MSIINIIIGNENEGDSVGEVTKVTDALLAFEQILNRVNNTMKGLVVQDQAAVSSVEKLMQAWGTAGSFANKLGKEADAMVEAIERSTVEFEKKKEKTALMKDELQKLMDKYALYGEKVPDNLQKIADAYKIKSNSIAENKVLEDDMVTTIGNLISSTKGLGDALIDCAVKTGFLNSKSSELTSFLGEANEGISSVTSGLTMVASGNKILGTITAITGAIKLAGAAFKYFAEKDVRAAVEEETKFLHVTANTKKKIDELALKNDHAHSARSVFLGEIIRNALVTRDNFTKFAVDIREIILDLKDNALDIHQANAAYGKAFSEILAHAQRLGIEGNSAILHIIQSARAAGLEVAEIQQYVNEKLTEAVKALEQYSSTFDTKKIREELLEVQKRLSENNITFYESIELHETLKNKEQELAAASNDVERSWGFMQVATMETFGALRTEGKSVIETIRLMGGHLDNIGTLALENGLRISSSVNYLTDIQGFIAANENLVKRIDATNSWVSKMNDSARMSKTVFTAFARETIQQLREVEKAGLKGPQALQLMGPQLQKINDYAVIYGLTLDKNTEGILKRAHEAGIIHETEHELLINICNAINEVVSAIKVLYLDVLATKEGFKGLQDAALIKMGINSESLPEMLNVIKNDMKNSPIPEIEIKTHIIDPWGEESSSEEIPVMKFHINDTNAAKFLADYGPLFAELIGLIETEHNMTIDLSKSYEVKKILEENKGLIEHLFKKHEIKVEAYTAFNIMYRLVDVFKVLFLQTKKENKLKINTSNATGELSAVDTKLARISHKVNEGMKLNIETQREGPWAKEEIGNFSLSFNTQDILQQMATISGMIQPVKEKVEPFDLRVRNNEVLPHLQGMPELIQPIKDEVSNFNLTIKDEEAMMTFKQYIATHKNWQQEVDATARKYQIFFKDTLDPTKTLEIESVKVLKVLENHKGAFANNKAGVEKLKAMIKQLLDEYDRFGKKPSKAIRDTADALEVVSSKQEKYNKALDAYIEKLGYISTKKIVEDMKQLADGMKATESQLKSNPALVESLYKEYERLKKEATAAGKKIIPELLEMGKAVAVVYEENKLLTKHFGLTNEKIRELTPETRGLGLEFAKIKEAEEKLNKENKLLSTYLNMNKESIKNLDPAARKAKLGLAQMKEAAKNLKDENKLLIKHMGMTEKSIKELDPAARKSAVALAKERSEMEKAGKETDKNAKKTNKLTEGLTALATQFGASEKDVATFLSTSSNAGEKMVAFLNITDAVIGKLGEMGIISKSSTEKIKNMIAGFKSIGSGVSDLIKSGGNPLKILSGGIKIATGLFKLFKKEFDWVGAGISKMRQFGGATKEMGKKLGETAKELKSMKKAFAQLAAEMIKDAKMLDLKDFKTWSKELSFMTIDLVNNMNEYNKSMDEAAKKQKELSQEPDSYQKTKDRADLSKQLVKAEKTRRETAEMAEQLDTAFASLVEKADLLGTHGERSMVRMIDKARELRDMGIDSPEIFKYVKEQIETGLTGLEEYLQRATEKVTEIKELETGMEDQSGEELQKSIQEIADLKASLADITTPEGFNRALEYAAGYMHAMQKDGKSMIEIVNQMGPQLDTLITLGESGPYETEMLSELLSLREFVSANEEVMTSIGASQKMLESFGNTGTLTSDLLKASTRDAVAYYDTLIAKGADEKQALEALAPLLAKQAWYAEQGGFVTEDIFDSDTLALLDKAREQGINMDIFLPTGEKMVDLLQQIKDILAGEDKTAPEIVPNPNLINTNINYPDQGFNSGEDGENTAKEEIEKYWARMGVDWGNTAQSGQEADEALNDAGTEVNELSNKIGELDHQLNNTMGNLDNTGAAANSVFGDAGNAVQGFGDTVEQVDSQLNNQLAESFNNTDLSAQTTFGNADAAVQSLGNTVGQVETQLNEALVYSIETAGSSAQLNFANASTATNTWADSITAVGGQVETTLPAQLEYMAEMGIGTFETVNQSSLTVSGTLDTIHGQLGIQLIESLGSLEDNTEEAMNSITKKTGEWANSLGGVEDQLAKDLPGAVGELDEIYADKMTGHSIVTETHKWKYSLQEINDILGKELPATTEELDKKYAHVTADINKYLEVTSKEGYKSRMTLEEMVAEYEKVYKAYSTVATWEQTEEARNQAADYERQMENLKDAIEETMPSLDNWSEKFNTFKEELSGSIGVDRNMISIARGIRESGQTLKEIDDMIEQSLNSGASGMAAWLKALGPEQETIDELKKLQSEYDTLNEKKEKTDDEMQKMIDLQTEIAEGTTTAHQEFMKDEAALMDSQNLMVAYFHSLKAEGKNVSEIMSIMGTGFQALVDKSMEDFDGGAGFGMTKAFEDLYNLQTKISNNQTLVQGIEGLSEAIHGMGDSMLYMSQETFGDFEGSAIRAFEKLREANFTNTQSLQMIAPLLQDLSSYADEYGLSMDSATAELYDQARAQGLIQEAQKSDTEQLVEINLELTSVMKDMVNIFGTIGNSDAFDSVTKKAKLAGEAVAAINGPDIDTVTGYKIQGNKVADLLNEHIQLGQTVSGLKNELQMIDQMDPFTIMIDRVRALKDEFIQMYETLAFVARSATINDLGEKVPISVEARRYSESHGVTPRERIAALGNIHPYDTYDVPGRPGVQAKPTTVNNNFSITIENNSEDTPRTIIDKFIVGYKRNEKDVQGVIKNEL